MPRVSERESYSSLPSRFGEAAVLLLGEVFEISGEIIFRRSL
jgi:hypothetical protein